MKVYYDIMELASCSLEDAKRVRNAIDNDWALDWSECTKSAYVKTIMRYALALGVAK